MVYPSSSSSYPSSSSSSSSSFSYDVFLSFRGSDTRYGFTGNLYRALEAKGIHTFMDDEEIQSGDGITPSLMKAIQDSRFAIVVLSQNYASSSFCLDELVHIIHTIKGQGQGNNNRLVLPVFYEVDPSHLRHGTGTYGEAIAKHEKRFNADHHKERLHNWKMALHQVANLSGRHFKQQGNEYEHEFIDKIVELISSKIDRSVVPLHVGDHLVGLESRVLQMNSLLELGSDDGVLMVGIWGVGGIGKSTLARAVYNSIAHQQFEGMCFLENVRENSGKHGLVHLQKTLLGKLLGEKATKLESVHEGISIIKHRLYRKKVLLILDDVDKKEQLQALVGSPDWFGYRSRVIITTRDKHLLASHGVERTYEVEKLVEKEAHKLLSLKAFKNGKVDPSYEDILKRFVLYASGLPLALELIGSNLFGKSVEEWESALVQYKRIPHSEIQKILKVSFDTLEEDEQKIFLDIACFFKGYALQKVEDILCAHHGHCMKYHIGVLLAKCLIKIESNRSQIWGDRQDVMLHDLIEDMGKEIVRQESPENPGLRSRLWFEEDIIQVFKENKGTDKIQIIIWKRKNYNDTIDFDGKPFKKMDKLKTFIFHVGEGDYVLFPNPMGNSWTKIKRKADYFIGDLDYLPNSLRVLEWQYYPFPSLPFGLQPDKLNILRLSPCYLKSLGLFKIEKKFVYMRTLEFNYSEITQIPDLSCIPNLEELSFHSCRDLIKIDESVGLLDKLRYLDASGCTKLRYFPPLKLPSLKLLRLFCCHSLENFPEILGKMENITMLDLHYTLIRELPYSIHNLTQLKELKIQDYQIIFQLPSDKIRVMFPSLQHLKVDCKLINRTCHISDGCFPTLLTFLTNLRTLRHLSLLQHHFTFVPSCITELHSLKELHLYYCYNLMGIRWIPPNLEELCASGCESLKYLDLTSSPCLLRTLHFYDCNALEEIRGIPPTIQVLYATNCRSLIDSCRRMLLNQELHKEIGDMFLYLPGSRIPKWFEHCSTGHSLSFWFRGLFPAISTCHFIGLEKLHYMQLHPKLNINGNIVDIQFAFPKKSWPPSLYLNSHHIFIFDIKQIKFKVNVNQLVLLENEWNHAEFSFHAYDYIYGKPEQLANTQIGLHVFKQESSSMKDIRFTNPYEIERNDDDDDARDSSNSTEKSPMCRSTNVKGGEFASRKRKVGTLSQ